VGADEAGGSPADRASFENDSRGLEAARDLARGVVEPAVVGNVALGTAGWTESTLIRSGRFYPRGLSRSGERLSYYAKHFSMVEVDATYYSLLPPTTAERWAGATPADFEIDVKAHPVFTGHPIDFTRLPAELAEAAKRAGHEERGYADRLPPELVAEMERRFVELLSPLRSSGKLGCVMLQFPPWFRATRGNARRIEVLAERLVSVPLAVEFRHPSWLAEERRERVFALLSKHRMSYVAVDEPDVPRGGVPPVIRVTNPALAIVRFHGKNAAAWRRRGASVQERFEYLYSPEELRPWVEPVRTLSREAERVHAVFNNCVSDYAVVNAKGLCVLLAAEQR
jgi:uncharacterized protein YecE (DUF72 family)